MATVKDNTKRMRPVIEDTARLELEISRVREEERKRIAADLHDEIGAMTIGMGASLVIAETMIREKNFEKALEVINKIKRELDEATANFKKIAMNVRPSSLEVKNFSKTLKEYVLTVSKRSNLNVDFSLAIDNKKLNTDVVTVIYRVIQEALNNVMKHAQARNVKIRLYSDADGLKFDIHDDGKGFNTESDLRGPGVIRMGINGIRDRIESIGGRVTIKSQPSKGSAVSVVLPHI